jgi:hypothetical protein
MSFEKGSFAAQFLRITTSADPAAMIEAMRRTALPQVDREGILPVAGWVGHLDLLDREMTDSSCTAGNLVHVQYARLAKKVPSKLFAAKYRAALAARAASCGRRLKARDKRDVRGQVLEALLPDMPWVPEGWELLVAPANRLMMTSAVSTKALERVQKAWAATVGDDAEAQTPSVIAYHAGYQARDMAAFSLAGPVEEMFTDRLGAEFLTYVWYCQECCKGQLLTGPAKTDKVALSLDGKLMLLKGGKSDRETTAVKDLGRQRVEAMRAILTGKLIDQATVLSVVNDVPIRATISADTFALRGVKITGRYLDTATRIDIVAKFLAHWCAAFIEFLRVRSDKDWVKSKTLRAWQAWAAGETAGK